MTEATIDEGIDEYESSHNFTEAEKVALRYSELMDTCPEKIDEKFYSELAKHYTTEEIIELGVYIGFNVGYHGFLERWIFIQCLPPMESWLIRKLPGKFMGIPRSLI